MILKKTALLSFVFLSNVSSAAVTVKFHHAPISQLSAYHLFSASASPQEILSQKYALKPIHTTREKNASVTRYQQMYQGVPVFGAQIMIRQSEVKEVNGQLVSDLNVNTTPLINSDQAIDIAKRNVFATHPSFLPQDEEVTLQLRSIDDKNWTLVYLVSFKNIEKNQEKFSWPHQLIDAKTGEIIKKWDSGYTYTDTGPGGNERVKEYWYGTKGLPELEMTQQGENCVMETPLMKLIDLKNRKDFENKYTTSYQYPCKKNVKDTTNGGYSPRNDAWYFTSLVSQMYQKWYGLSALQTKEGDPQQLIVRVHFGKDYANAFWDGVSVSLGDGDYSRFYPLTGLDIIGHEFGHGFTSQHSDLEYHDESGAINEAFSDMAGVAVRQYLLDESKLVYNKVHVVPDKITWKVGESVTPYSFFSNDALRYIDYPAKDGISAECLGKRLAKKYKQTCAISYSDLKSAINAATKDEDVYQSVLVHTASGIYNRAFYFLAKKLGIKNAFEAMLHANVNYWTPTTDFKTGACGVIDAAHDLDLDVSAVKSAFLKTGVDITKCPELSS